MNWAVVAAKVGATCGKNLTRAVLADVMEGTFVGGGTVGTDLILAEGSTQNVDVILKSMFSILSGPGGSEVTEAGVLPLFEAKDKDSSPVVLEVFKASHDVLQGSK